MPPRPTNRRRRALRAAALLALLGLLALVGARFIAVPWAIRRVLAGTGIAPVNFTIDSVDLSRLHLTNISAGSPPWLTADSVVVTYSLAALASARVRTISVRGGEWTIRANNTLDPGTRTGESSAPLSLAAPFERVDIEDSIIRIDAGDRTYEIEMHATIDGSPGVLRGDLRFSAFDADVSVTVTAREGRDGIVLDAATTHRAAIALEPHGINASFDSLAAHAVIARADDGENKFSGDIAIRGGAAALGDTSLSGVDAALEWSPREIRLTRFEGVVGDGGGLSIAPFALDTAAPVARARVTLTNLSLADWLPLLTGDRATGQGRFGGSIDVALDLSGEEPTLVELGGALRAEPGHGFLQVRDAEALGALLDRQSSRADELTRPLRDRIVSALRDFTFEWLTVDVSRDGNQTVARAYISGHGRHGPDPQGLNLTLYLHVDDALIGLASRVGSRAELNAAARRALEEFFATPSPGGAP